MATYFDFAATAPMHPAARDALISAIDTIGNPSSIHAHGQAAKRALETAREEIASTLGCDPIEVIFTSGGTESINLALKGLFWARNAGREALEQLPRPRVLAPLGEHHATIDALEWLDTHERAVIEWLPVDDIGRIRLTDLEAALARNDGRDVALLTLLMGNNEIGTVQPVREIAALAHQCGVPVHVDAVSAYGHLPVSLRDLGVDALSVSAHKIGGPVGIGALALSRAQTVEPLIHGGGQQRGVRSGTQDAPAAAAFAAAALAVCEPDALAAESARLHELRDLLERGIRASIPDATLRGAPTDSRLEDAGVDVPGRLPGNLHFTFPGCQGDSMLFLLDVAGYSVSTGSACQAGIPEASHVLLGLGLSETEALGALRFTLGRTTTLADVEGLLAELPAVVERARAAGYSSR